MALKPSLASFGKKTLVALLLTDPMHRAYVPGQSPNVCWGNQVGCQEGTLPAGYLWPLSGLNGVKAGSSKTSCSAHWNNSSLGS